MIKRIISVVIFYVLVFAVIAIINLVQTDSPLKVCYHYNFNSPYYGGWGVGEMFCPNDAVIAFKTLVALIRGLWSTWPFRYAVAILLSLPSAILYVLRGYI